ncbi:MAG: pyruvate dehydrogenase (acetyl-transferring) E1 component subunit alpha [Acidilobaceae archaeon]|nr:pyruvate dehydrogenase (acetyl-transferring) E1 component subunit alpha [Acidilobaceae archaeon]MDW7974427.1 pyruvate dehydrogenase (acetyl-transferring) E1 component subunit alpha [Sulfolobales archaeon]
MAHHFEAHKVEEVLPFIDAAVSLRRFIDEEGNPVEETKVQLSSELLLKMYVTMVRARILDEWLLKMQRVGRVAIHAPNAGQEAIAGAVMALREEDWLFPSYRELSAYIARGMSEEEIIDRAMANADDPLRGSEFAVYGNEKYNIVPAPVPVGAQIPLAVGAAIAAKILGHKVVAMTIFGDGATSRGDFHSGMNFAGVFKAPVVLVIQNNGWAISLPSRRQTAAKTLAIRGVGYGVPGIRVDGNDIVAMYITALEAAERARAGEGPTLIEALTYRLGPHTTADDPDRYRSKEEVKLMERLDPIVRFGKYLKGRGVMTEREERDIWKEWGEKIESIVKKCYEKPSLPVSVIFENVYSEPTWNLKEQMEELEESLRIMKELGVKVE